MKMPALILSCLAFSSIISGQDSITVVEKTMKVGVLATETEYYGFAEGDKVIFTFAVDKGNIKDVTIAEYPNNIKFAQHTVEKIDKYVMTVNQKGIYKFEYVNNFILPRNVSIKIQRIPRTAGTKAFNTGVKWIDKIDTTYKTQDGDYQLKSDTSVQEVLNTKAQLNSSMSGDNASKKLIDFVLPAGTVRWAYWIGVGDKGDQAFEKDKQDFLATGLKPGGSTSPIAGMAFGQIAMTRSTGAENVRYFFISSNEEGQKFMYGQTFGRFKGGEATVDNFVMNYANKNIVKYYLGLSNPLTDRSAEVTARIIAIVVEKNYEGKTEKRPVYSTSKIPVHIQ